ncbi:MAG: type I restriction enzyme HsdR N-terminal domain-containing protein [Symploca sp. SIO1C4]|uniref:Type I restriction enzyme HsdR N-terminal domain-containing protein n=1 Tax=Symploca sp. SIO1C4 TaxID=2607765 RepID=A0A6B3N9V5_9CYAN|nr:type I restriction enzyme HsdR N-terminal domain-containing protein [Symploca sp. SIO1C4]
MTTTIAVTDAIKSINEAESRFNLSRTNDLNFFKEWQENLPELTTAEQETLDRIKNSYLYNSADGAITEATVNLLLISPLLYLAGFCDPPFKLRAEKSVEIAVEEVDEIYRGRIDTLVLKNLFWLTLIESKQTKFSFSVAIPQALAYMMANPNPEQPTFGLVTNGDNFIFLKLVKKPVAQYDLSTDFSIFARPHNELYEVLRVMKRIGTEIAP